MPRPDGSHLVLAATDPANPYGAALPWPRSEGGRRPSRSPGAYVVLRDGVALLYVERGGKGLLRLGPAKVEGEELDDALRAVLEAARDGRISKLAVERMDGEPVIGSDLEDSLTAVGFQRRPRKLVA